MRLLLSNDPGPMLKRNRQPYLCEVSGSLVRYILTDSSGNPDGRVYDWRDGSLPKWEMFLFGMVKRDVEDCMKRGILPKYKRPKYFEFSPFSNPGRKDAVSEVDINGAYWQIAYELGYITQKTYDRGLKVSKSTRLAALGSLAKKTNTYEYNGDFVRPLGAERKITANFFFSVAAELGERMEYVAGQYGEMVEGFWVDALFGHLFFERAIQESFMEIGLESKVVPLAWMDVESDRLIVQELHSKKGKPPRCKIIPRFSRGQLYNDAMRQILDGQAITA